MAPLRSMGLILAIALALAGAARAYYLPGTYPQEFFKGGQIQAEVNSLVSSEAEVPYDYYSMPFCKPPEGVRKSSGSINPGTILLGIRIENSPYNFTMLEETKTARACAGPEHPDGAAPPLSGRQAKILRDRIRDEYRVRLILDNLPVTTYDLTKNLESIRPGFEVGYKAGGKYYVNNHLMFNILVHEVTPSSSGVSAARLDAAASLEAGGRRLLASGELSGARGAGELGDALAGALAGAERANGAASRSLLADGSGDAAPATPAAAATSYMIVGFEVVPCSIDRGEPGSRLKNVPCPESPTEPGAPAPQEVRRGAAVTYTYDVFWMPSDSAWKYRWDYYLRMPGGRVHWFSILNSLMVVLVMTCIVAMIMLRTIRRDLAHYEALLVDPGSAPTAAEAGAAGGQPGPGPVKGPIAGATPGGHPANQPHAPAALDVSEESGWKLVSGDVFRAPANPLGLAVRVGSGVQILASAGVTLLFATLGFLSPASRGSLLTAAMVLYVLMSSVAGFAAVWAWGAMTRSHENWFKVCWRVACFFPGGVSAALAVLNLFLWGSGSSGTIPLAFFFSAASLWILISIPLAYAGGLAAAKREIRPWPVRTNQIPRHVPPPHWASHPAVLLLAAGLLPFGTIFVELYFAMTSLWQGFFYYIFGFLAIVSLLTLLITIEVSVVCTYVQLCAEDYQWWWRSFYRGGSIALYVGLYSLGFLVNTLHNLSGPLAILLYVSYMGLLTWCLYLASGTVGFLSSFLFTVKIFESVKAD